MEIFNLLIRISKKYLLSGLITGYTESNNGHINDTYRVKFAIDEIIDEEYIFQRINHYVFKDPIKVMDNIKVITLHQKTGADCEIISFINNKVGKNYTLIDNDYWRVCRFVENSVTYETVENSKVLYSAGYAFGRFQHLVAFNN